MDQLQQQLENMRRFFNSGATKEYAFRKQQLLKLKQVILAHETELYEALDADLKKSAEESWVTETGLVITELNNAIRHLKKWMKPKPVATNLLNLPSSSRIINEPLGVVMIIGPWNYPFQLLFNPLIGAIAAGNCVVLKPSEFAPATEQLMKKLVKETFDEQYILFAEGEGHVVVPELMNNFTFDHVFYTGSTTVGKIIYKMAAERLVPVTLELGGKSPCVVESDANIAVAAKRIAVAKFSNAGQMCVAPDYILVHESKKEELIDALQKTIKNFFTEKPEDDYNYGKIINEKQFNRLTTYINPQQVVFGGRTNIEKLFIEPTVITNVSLDSPVMKDEIFGPILPVLSFSTKEEALQMIEQNKNPLAFYVYTSGKENEQYWLSNVAFGGGCVNNCSWHLTNHHLPFGGRGFSGTGAYHGRFSFDTFSHKKSVMKTPTWFDPAIKYPPLKGKLKLFKMVIK